MQRPSAKPGPHCQPSLVHQPAADTTGGAACDSTSLSLTPYAYVIAVSCLFYILSLQAQDACDPATAVSAVDTDAVALTHLHLTLTTARRSRQPYTPCACRQHPLSARVVEAQASPHTCTLLCGVCFAVQGTSLIDLMTPIGELACKVPPSVDLVAVMGKLTGTLTRLE